MIDILRIPDYIKIDAEISQGSENDCEVRFDVSEDEVKVFVKANKSYPRAVVLRWYGDILGKDAIMPVRIMGDTFERGYGDFEWRNIVPDRYMPWYFFLYNGARTTAYGVKVRPNSFCSWQCDDKGISLILDVRCGGEGVMLCGRELHSATIVSKTYRGITTFAAAKDFCKVMCTDPLLPETPIYGGNNWYYAYGNSSHEEIVEDTRLIAELTEGLNNRPFMVIDDGWQPNRCAGPWDRGNERFPDMKRLADEMKTLNVRPGIWVRFLHDPSSEVPNEWRLPKRNRMTPYLDPSRPEVIEKIRSEVKRFVEWGYELIKHDFTFFDMFGRWGRECRATVTENGWSFFDRSRTSAEITLDLYRNILEAAEGKAYILACNCVSHLCAGLAHINRIGDDTSGYNWDITRNRGVNTLAFRLPQHNAFYALDADCIGVIPGRIDWKYNRRWLHLLAHSGTPLFLSSARSSKSSFDFEEMKEAFRLSSLQEDSCEPLDWMTNNIPSKWRINGEIINFDWYLPQGIEFHY